MKLRSSRCFAALLTLCLIAPQFAQANVQYSKAMEAITFEKNAGQIASDWQFLSRSSGYNVAISATELLVQISKAAPTRAVEEPVPERISTPDYQTTDLMLRWIDANPEASIVGQSELPTRSHYLIGNNADDWTRDVAHFEQVRTVDVYQGIDVVYQNNEGHLRFDFIVHPSADPETIAFRIDGASGLSIDRDGSLIIDTVLGELSQQAPLVFQDSGKRRETIKGRYSISDDQVVSFTIDQYDDTKALVIDPTLNFASYLGGSKDDQINDHEVQSDGSIVIFGMTNSLDFPAINAFQSGLNGADSDVFISKIDPTTGTLLYSTYFGGSALEEAKLVSTNSAGDIVIAGITASADFPTVMAFDDTFAGGGLDMSDGFVAKIRADGAEVLYSTFLGGEDLFQSEPFSLFGRERIRGLYVDKTTDKTYIVGNTSASDFPVTHILNSRSCMENETNAVSSFVSDVFVSILNDDGSLHSATCLGGTERDAGRGIAVKGNRIAVVGHTRSDGFPVTPGAYQSTRNDIEPGSYEAFVSVLNADATTLLHSTFIGGSGIDFTQAVEFNSQDAVVAIGSSFSLDFPVTANAFQQTPSANPNPDIFISSMIIFGLSSDLNSLQFSSYLGGTYDDYGLSIELDSQDRIYINGSTGSYDFPLANELQTVKGSDSGPSVVVSAPTASTGTDAALITEFDQIAGTSVQRTAIATTSDTGGPAINLLVSRVNNSVDHTVSDLGTILAPTHAVTFAEIFPTVNGDVFADIITGNCADVNRVYSGDGSGGFNLLSTFSDASFCTQDIAVVDVNADNIPDVVASDGTNLVYHLGDGLSGFGAATPLPVTVTQPTSLSVANVPGGSGLSLIITDYAGADQFVSFPAGAVQITALAGSASSQTTSVLPVRLGQFGNGGVSLLFNNDNGPMRFYEFDGAGGLLAPVSIGGADIASTQAVTLSNVTNAILFSGLPLEGLVAWETLSNGDEVVNVYSNADGSSAGISALGEPRMLGSETIVKSVGGSSIDGFNTNIGAVVLVRDGAYLQEHPIGTSDSFLSVLSSDASSLIYSSYYGGSGNEFTGWGLNVNENGDVTASGNSVADDLPTLQAVSASNSGQSDGFIYTVNILDLLDDDGDGIANNLDNCTQVSNPLQEDYDNDGYGNICDADFNQDQIVNFLDVGLFVQNFMLAGVLVTDMNSDGITNFLDFFFVTEQIFQAPGPAAQDF